MAQRRNCIYQGFAVMKKESKRIVIACDWDGKNHDKDYCKKCDYYTPRKVDKA